MKALNKFMLCGSLLLGAVSLTGCSDSDDNYDFDGIDHERVFFANTNNMETGTVIKTPVGLITGVDGTFSVKATKSTTKDMRVTVAIDNGLVAAYNAEHGTNYETLPDGTLTLSHTALTIPAGSETSKDTLHVTITDDKAATVNSDNGYLVPIVIKSCDGERYQPSSNLSVRYLTIAYMEKSINEQPTELLGTELGNDVYKTWKCIATDNLNPSGFEGFFGGSSWYSWGFADTSNPVASFTIDMQQTHKITGVSLGRKNSCLKDIKIEVSSDNQVWADLGSTNSLLDIGSSYYNRNSYVVFYGAIPCRYIRITETLSTSSSWWKYYASISGFKVTAQD